jgi:DNA-binding transcriptional ArsR family regulator
LKDFIKSSLYAQEWRIMMKKNELYCYSKAINTDLVKKVKNRMPDEGELYDLADFFKVLGDSTRVKIMWILDESEMCVCDLAELLNITKSAISHQLYSLKQANLVKYRREGKHVFYSLADDHVRQIFETGMEHIREII